MAIQPIDLQALFTQVDKVGKNQAALREGQQIQDSLQQAHVQRKLEENVQSVNESQNLGEEAGKIKEDQRRGSHTAQDTDRETQDEETAEEDEVKPDLIRDPALGRNIDISG